MASTVFLSKDDVIWIHQREIETAGGSLEIRDSSGLDACVDSPKTSFEGELLYDVFEMAASYIVCITMRHPFLDGNKRTALACALTFLYINGITIHESYKTELADLVLAFLENQRDKEQIVTHFRVNSRVIQK